MWKVVKYDDLWRFNSRYIRSVQDYIFCEAGFALDILDLETLDLEVSRLSSLGTRDVVERYQTILGWLLT